MNEKNSGLNLLRRLFLSRLGLGAGVIGATVAGANAALAAPATPAAGDTNWKPARHPQDDWYDQIPGQHRFLFDTDNPDAITWGLRFASNYFTANQNDYGLKESDLAVIIVVRHRSTSFSYNNAMWAKYGKHFAEQAEYVDPKSKEAPTVNVFTSSEGAGAQPGPIDEILKKGAHFAVCSMSSHAIAGRVAKATGAKPDDVFKEITSNLIGNAHMVPAGIVAVSRAQERGYTLATVV